MAESEDRTQPASKLKQQQARERGQVAHSPELTSAAAMLATASMLGVFGGPLFDGLLRVVRDVWSEGLAVSIDADAAVAHLRGAAFDVIGPIVLLAAATVGAGVAAHAAQVGWLWSPALLSPDIGRLWGVGAGRGLAARAGRGAWTLAKMAVVLIVAVWAIRTRFEALSGLGRLDIRSLAQAWAEALRGLLTTMAGAALVLGLVDLLLQRRRFGDLLRLTPEEAREDQKATDGDPALRSRRKRMARAWRGDAPELLVGAKLIVAGDNGLAVILGGGPPPKRVNLRGAADKATGRAILRAAGSAGIAVVERGEIALRLARASTQVDQPLGADLLADLAAIWPAS